MKRTKAKKPSTHARNVRDGKPPKRRLEGVFDEAAMENHAIASFKAMVEDSRNSPRNHYFEEMDGDRQPWGELSAAAKLQYVVRDAVLSDVPFKAFAEVAKEVIGENLEAALQVLFEHQKEHTAIERLLPDDGRTEPTPLVDQVKDIMDYASRLENQEKERRQGREKLFEGISNLLDGKPPVEWQEGAKTFLGILQEDRPTPEEVKTQQRGGRVPC